jgi:hypothetical protein
MFTSMPATTIISFLFYHRQQHIQKLSFLTYIKIIKQQRKKKKNNHHKQQINIKGSLESRDKKRK